MFGFFRSRECRYPCTPDPQPAVIVPFTSPARALEQSLTSPETRGEWVTTYTPNPMGNGASTKYRNEARDITVTRYFGYYGGGSISTPFTLNQAEEAVVKAALGRHDDWRRQVTELAALNRLTAQGIEAPSGGETGTGSTEGESPVPERNAP